MEKGTYLNLLAQFGISGAHPGGMALTRRILSRERITPDMVLLDAGCGAGQTSAYIAANYPCKVVGVDINPQMLEKARRLVERNHPDIILARANVMDLPFRRNCFDLILSESVIAFTDIRRTLKEYYRVLKPGGHLLAIEVTAAKPFDKNSLKEIQSIIGITSVPTLEEWRRLLQEGGFSNVQVVYHKRNNWFQSFFPKINRAFQDYVKVMSRYRHQLGFAVYRCVI